MLTQVYDGAISKPVRLREVGSRNKCLGDDTVSYKVLGLALATHSNTYNINHYINR